MYLGTSTTIAQGDVVLPLDDTYIHFQYARQLALGQPYVYNPGDPPTSGATSFLYPYLLAVGYLIGFQGLHLGLWAVIIGAFTLLAATWTLFLLGREYNVPEWMSLIGSLCFALNGAVNWHMMSGMETGLMMALTLVTLYMVVSVRFWGLILSASLLALSRPEGGLLAILAVIAYLAQARSVRFPRPARPYFLLIPLFAVGVQPLMNWLLTGSFSATGSQAKSLFSMIPFEWSVVIGRILGNFARFWRELLNGTDGRFMPGVLPLLALVGLIMLLNNRERRIVGIMIFGWLVAVSGAISTLDTAFWHFKRYQMPLLSLVFPLAIWGAGWLWRFNEHALMRVVMHGVNRRTFVTDPLKVRLRLLLPPIYRALRYVFGGYIALVLLVGLLLNSAEFLRLYRVNVQNVVVQTLAMARWLNANTAEEAVIGVHDVGLIRYIGERYTIDMVGLTTPGAADAWRNGPGAVAEFLLHHEPLPDYIAAYTTARGLNYLAQTDLYGDLLAAFPASFNPVDNVALAADFQGIFQPRWTGVMAGETSRSFQGSLQPMLFSPQAIMLDLVDVGHLASEAEHQYHWQNHLETPGFTTEFYQMDYVSCPHMDVEVTQGEYCRAADSVRRITASEAFTLRGVPGESLILVTRLQPAAQGMFDLYLNDEWLAQRVIPEIPGQWLEVPTYIPAERVTETLHIRIVPQLENGVYMPALHRLYQGSSDLRLRQDDPAHVTFQDGAIQLLNYSNAIVVNSPVVMEANFTWQSDGAMGDYILFVHLYAERDKPPIAQLDARPGEGTLPPGNWLPGLFSDRVRVDVSGVPPGEYEVAIGFYDAVTFERLVPTDMMPDDGFSVAADGRLFVGTIQISAHE
ncbi:MAG: hypothetical protein SF029_14015 [bacterium]|nr:hypothetical protein [bacterium]